MNDRKKTFLEAKTGIAYLIAIPLINAVMVALGASGALSADMRVAFFAIVSTLTVMYYISFPVDLVNFEAADVFNLFRDVFFSHLITQFIIMPISGVVSILGAMLCAAFVCLDAYLSLKTYFAAMKYIENENYNDYVFFAQKTDRLKAITAADLALVVILFGAGAVLTITTLSAAVLSICVLVVFAYNARRTFTFKLGRMSNVSYYIGETFCTALAFALLIIIDMLGLNKWLILPAALLLLPTAAMSYFTYKAIGDDNR